VEGNIYNGEGVVGFDQTKSVSAVSSDNGENYCSNKRVNVNDHAGGQHQ
jgi:hypothetical protein